MLTDLCVRLGRGDGSFDPPVCYGSGVIGARKMISVDLNHDGQCDFVVSANAFDDDTKLGVLLANGDGTFQPAQQYCQPRIPTASCD